MKKIVKVLVVVLLVFAMLPGCATMTDKNRTQAEGTGVGAVLGGLLGYAVGGGKGAAIGAAAGAGLGFLVGNEIAKRKQAYATTEEFLDAEISNTQEYNKTAIAYNAKLSKDVATLEKQSKTLRAQYDKGTVDKKVLAAKSDELQKKIDASKKLENTLAKELDVQTAILADEKKARPAGDQYVARLEKEVGTLQKNLDKLRDGSTQLAQIDQRLSV
ncbi:glycine zipper domain-containing protein [Desulfomicrobium sp. ZS1]|uniref:YMGG-like glycine zipper-containing protein n=1 Tax=Desulfomicrobium sp. ZS1 TaxID=2952228 RepID=UPI0020B4324F|nr:YMGG-like glycine zipper-containing protein [Desulfomicrobium sp. ZS1]UTF51348.1 glycine zipper domain-containing protein [Desulfomicrobium sp. ZS1]